AAVPDRLGPAELAPHLTGRWRRIEWRAEIDSTQRLARDLARAGAEEGTCVVAEAQSAGRGRLGRTWHSPPGTNLYCSVVLRPPLAPAAVPQLALVAGVAVAAAVAETTTLSAEIKWPNDVLVGGRKVAGILTELEAELERVRFVIVGIGVNLNTTAFPAELAERATSLALASGRPVDRAAFTGRLLAALEERYGRRAPRSRGARSASRGRTARSLAACSASTTPGPSGFSPPRASGASWRGRSRCAEGRAVASRARGTVWSHAADAARVQRQQHAHADRPLPGGAARGALADQHRPGAHRRRVRR